MTCQPHPPIKHRHHIMPRYRGGSDDPSNLVEVSVVQHAMWHFCNYQLWGEPEDRLAWRALAGSVGKEEIILEKLEIAKRRSREKVKQLLQDPEYYDKQVGRLRKLHSDPEHIKRNLEHLKKIQIFGVEASKSPEAIAKKKETLRNIDHQKGEKNSQYGTRWIHSLDLKISRRVRKTDELPEGWKEGRVIDFDKKLCPGVTRNYKRKGIPRDWFHPVYGEHRNKTIPELSNSFPGLDLKTKSLSDLANGHIKQYKEWIILSEVKNIRYSKNTKLNKKEEKQKTCKSNRTTTKKPKTRDPMSKRAGIPRNWYHRDYGYVLNTTSSELCEEFKDQKLDKGALSQVSLGRNSHHKGWCMDTNIVNLTPKRDIKMDWEHDVYGVVLQASVNEMVDRYKNQELRDYGLFKVVNGNIKRHKGWKLRKD
jgi:hypothetical protein